MSCVLPQGYSGADLASLMREAAMCALKESLAKDRANGGQVIARSDSRMHTRASTFSLEPLYPLGSRGSELVSRSSS